MRFTEILFIALGLAMDAFAVALAASIKLHPVRAGQIFRFAWHFGLFQALMPVIGYAASRSVADAIERWDHWAAFGLLAFIGVRAILAALSGEETPQRASDPTKGMSLVTYSIATSIDALAVGLSLGVLGAQLWLPCLVIGLVTGALTVAGMLLGSRIGKRFGTAMEIAGGVILIAIGLRILMDHVL